MIAVVGITSDLEGEEMDVAVPGFKGGDRTSLDLPKEEEDLLKAVKSTGKPLVVVLMNGSALSVNWANENANAILEAWYAGEEGGTAIAESLAGVNNPAGRLPVTFYKSVEQLPPFEDYSMKNRTYRYFEGTASLSFRIRTELFEVYLCESETLRDHIERRRPAQRRCRCEKYQRTRRRRSCPALFEFPEISRCSDSCPPRNDARASRSGEDRTCPLHAGRARLERSELARRSHRRRRGLSSLPWRGTARNGCYGRGGRVQHQQRAEIAGVRD